MEQKLIAARKLKELRGQGIGWMVFTDIEVSSDGSSGEGVRHPVLKSSTTEGNDQEVGRKIAFYM